MRARPFASLRTSLCVLVGLAVVGLVACAVSSTTPTVLPTRQPPTATAKEVPTSPPSPRATTAPPPTEATTYAGKPLANFGSDDFVGAGRCSVCHTSLKDGAGTDVSIDAQWRSTMMANAARDPLFLASVSREIERAPALATIIEDKCSACHMPMAHAQAQVDGTTASMFGAGFLDPKNALSQSAMDGVSCALCHQITDRNLGTKESFSGHYVVDTSTVAPDRLAYGPFAAPQQEMMRKGVGFTPVEGIQTTEARLCATCHTLYTPYVDATGKVLGEFPEQTPYLEWQHSAYSDAAGQPRACQSCHMPAAAAPALLSNVRTTPPLSPRDPFGQHYFVGGNVLMLGLLKAHAAELELTCSSAHLDASLGRLLAQVQQNTASLSFASAKLSGSELKVVLELRNLAGHKLPTGYPSRRMWIHVQVTDGSGKVVFESGQPRADGSIVGEDGDADEMAYEPHYDVITKPDQVQVYQSVMVNSDGEVTRALLRAASYIKDNRLLPQGFDKGTAGEALAVRGQAAQDANFIGGTDHIAYAVDVGSASEPFTIRAELLYQTLSYRFSEDLESGGAGPAKRFATYYAETDHMPVTLTRAEHTVR